MFEFDTDVDKKLNAPSKRKIYDMLVGRAKECLKTAKSVCLLGLSNWRYGEWILAENKNVERVTIVESSQLKFMYKDLEKLNKYNIIYVNDDKYVEALEGLLMKFDCIIMNPPYSRNLHLKILAEAIKHLKDEKSVCINLSPVRWLQDVVGHLSKRSDYTQFSKKLGHSIQSIDIISAKSALSLFDGGASADLGIYVCDNHNQYQLPDIKQHYGDFILEKVVFKIIDNDNVSKHITKEITSKFFVTIPESHGHLEAKDWCDIISPVKKFGREKSKGTHAWYVMFDTDEEAEFFRLFLMSKFIRFINQYVKMNMSNRPNCIPWLGEATNPRTGLKGYKGEWTDADLYQFFNITLKEQKVIEKTMAKYDFK